MGTRRGGAGQQHGCLPEVRIRNGRPNTASHASTRLAHLWCYREVSFRGGVLATQVSTRNLLGRVENWLLQVPPCTLHLAPVAPPPWSSPLSPRPQDCAGRSLARRPPTMPNKQRQRNGLPISSPTRLTSWAKWRVRVRTGVLPAHRTLAGKATTLSQMPIGALQQQLPSALKILHMRDGVPQLPFLCHTLTQLFGGESSSAPRGSREL